MTWDHPRGYRVLDRLDLGIAWDRQSLEDFESRPVREFAATHQLAVVDHPNLGTCIADDALQPLDTLFAEPELAALRDRCAGPSFDSYTLDGRQWALPLDTATQVAAYRPDLLPAGEVPPTWDQVLTFAHHHRTVLCLGGAHAFLMFAAVCASLGSPWPEQEDRVSMDSVEALTIMAELLATGDPEEADHNPIGILERMARDPDAAVYCPLLYGYITYQEAAGGRRALQVADAPRGPAGIGSVLGGTGLALTSSAPTDTEHGRATLRQAISTLLSDEVQLDLYDELGGQSSLRAAWESDRAHGFYSRTRTTLDHAWVRPRNPGYPHFQHRASEVIRQGLMERQPPELILAGIVATRSAAAKERV
ncbi:extracellular solute-binding protein [Nakamurella sp. YIM 132087]|uniref:Extracellular solute-binding protein n=1 Tax=Nakamurella alba TaxID=2665158 RepID=A0A7K1FGX8_9ACTN|nr:extracellular solute-binding protein [Nakamurella alba]MTD13372.1 extracellular solute-binding protein [Nakamurella alba]